MWQAGHRKACARLEACTVRATCYGVVQCVVSPTCGVVLACCSFTTCEPANKSQGLLSFRSHPRQVRVACGVCVPTRV